jgi:hypothetical protein
MANIFLIDPTASDSATVTGIGTLASSLPAHDVLNLAPGSRARWTSTTTPAIKLDLGASASWDAIIIAGHTAGASDTYRIRADDDEADVAGTATVDVTGRSFWPASGKPANHDVYHSFYLHGSTLTHRWLRLDWTIAAQPFDVRRIMVAAKFRPAINFSYGAGDGYASTGTRDLSVGGHTWGLYGRPVNVKRFSLAALTEAELYAQLHVLIRNRSAERDCFLCLDSDADARLADMMLWGTIQDPGIGTIQFEDRYEYPLSFVEQAP